MSTYEGSTHCNEGVAWNDGDHQHCQHFLQPRMRHLLDDTQEMTPEDLELDPSSLWMEHRGVGYSNTETAQKLRDQAVTLLDLAEQIDPIELSDKLPELNLTVTLRLRVFNRHGNTELAREIVVSQVGDGAYGISVPSRGAYMTIERVK